MHGGSLAALLGRVHQQRPLVHQITNYVAMPFTANFLLAMGAAPVMAQAPEEVEDMVAQAGALVLNLGTLSQERLEAMVKAGIKANQLGVPVVLDPVGVGATRFRNEACAQITRQVQVAVVRGNPSEIMAAAAVDGGTRGVDATRGVSAAQSAAMALARSLGAVVAVTGQADLITDGVSTYYCHNGHVLLQRLAGAGCAASAAIGAFAAVGADNTAAAAAGLALLGLAGEKAAANCQGQGSFMVAVLDAVSTMTPAEMAARARVTTSAAGRRRS